jgi:MFS family permease
MTVNMKIDLVGKEKRGLALGLNEFAGYISVAIVGFVTGYLAATFGLKPYPFYLGIAFAIFGLLISWLVVKDTKKFTLLEIKEEEKNQQEEELKSRSITSKRRTTTKPNTSNTKNIAELSFTEAFIITSWKNHSLLAMSQAGLVNNMIFGISWGLFTLYFASFNISVNDIGFLKALHPGIWGILQFVTGSLSDKVGRKILIYPGMLVQGVGIWVVLFFNSVPGWIAGMSLLGAGTALVYPTLLAAISDIAHPKWRATSLGVYRFWRDLGFVVGAIGIGFIADLMSINIAIQLVAWIAIASGIFVLVVMCESQKS